MLVVVNERQKIILSHSRYQIGTDGTIHTGPGLYEFLEEDTQIAYPVHGGDFDELSKFIESVWLDRVNRPVMIIIRYEQ